MCAIQSVLEPLSMLISCHMQTWTSFQRWISSTKCCKLQVIPGAKDLSRKWVVGTMGIGSSHVLLLPNPIPRDLQTTHPFLWAVHHLIGSSPLWKGGLLHLSYGLDLHMLSHSLNALLLAEYLHSKFNTFLQVLESEEAGKVHLSLTTASIW